MLLSALNLENKEGGKRLEKEMKKRERLKQDKSEGVKKEMLYFVPNNLRIQFRSSSSF